MIKNCSYKKNIATVFKAGLKWKAQQCRRILALLPMLRETRKNIQYLTADEIIVLRDAATQEGMSVRNRTILLLLIFTGLRGCDITALTLDAVDWKKETILISQQKTEAPVELPLSAVVGNAIYDYLTEERPDTGDCHVFLSETRPFSPLASRSIGSIVAKVFKTAGIRQEPGSRKGTHIFRHNLASSMLENGEPQPVITQTLPGQRPTVGGSAGSVPDGGPRGKRNPLNF